MLEFFTSNANIIFNIAIAIVLILGLLECLGLLLGVSLSAFMDNLSPFDIELSSEINKSADISDTGVSQVFNWLSLDKLPLMIWLVVFLTSFAVLGYVLNFISYKMFGFSFPSYISVPIAIFMGLIATGRLGNSLSRLIPKNQSSAVSVSSFSGQIATIISGTARVGSPAEGRVVDEFNQKHYVLIEPMEPKCKFVAGERVLLIKKTERCWQATKYSTFT